MDQGVPITDLPRPWQRDIRRLRTDCRAYRLQVRELQARIAELEAGHSVE